MTNHQDGDLPRSIGGTRDWRLVSAALMAVAVGIAVFVVQPWIPIDGLAIPAITSVVLLAVPVADSLSHRICLLACMASGLIPFIWSWPGIAGHAAALVVPLALASLTYFVAASANRRVALKRLVPRVAPIDLIPILVCCGSSLKLWRELHVSTPYRAMLELLPAWDNAAHFNMVATLAREGAMIDRLPTSPDGCDWAFAAYPQGYHAIVASLMNAMVRGGGAHTIDLLPAFVNANAVLVVIGLTVLVAGVCSVPFLRQEPHFAVPAAACVVGAFGLGPGEMAIASGFQGFWVACVLSASVATVSLAAPSAVSPVHVAAAAGAVSGIAFMWLPILTLAAPGVALMLFPRPRSRLLGSARQQALCLVLWGAALYMVVRAMLVISTISSPLTVVAADGEISPPNFISAMLSVAIGVCGGLLLRFRPADEQRTHLHAARRVSTLSFVPVAGVVTLATLAAVLFSNGDGLSYYFIKYLTALELVSWFVAAMLATTMVAALRRSGPLRLIPDIGVLLAVSAGLVLAFNGGLYWDNLPADPPMGAATGADTRSRAFQRMAGELLDAAHAQPANWVTYRRVYVAPPPSVLPSQLANQWYCALTATWTERITELTLPTDGDLAVPRRARNAIEQFRRRNPAVDVVAPSFALPAVEEGPTASVNGVITDASSEQVGAPVGWSDGRQRAPASRATR